MAKLRYYLPVEIVMIIFSWLPVKSLLRFAPLCRLWLSIISDHKFIKTHLTNSQKRPTLLIPGKIYNKNTGSWFSGACMLHPSYFEVPVSYLRFHVYQLFRIYITRYISYSESDIWRKIKVNKCVREFMYSQSSPSLPCFVIKRVLYINGSQKENPISFELHKEVFKPVSLSSIKLWSGNRPGSVSNIFEFKGSVAIISRCERDGFLSLWMLDDNGGNVTWTKNFNLEGLEAGFKIDQTFIYLGDGQLVTSGNRKNETIVLYDYEKKETKELHSPIRIAQSFFMHTDSLVSLPGFMKF